MAGFVLDESSVRLLRRVVREVVGEDKTRRRNREPRTVLAGRKSIRGTLNGSLDRGTFASPETATMSVFGRNPTTGVWTDTGINVTIEETGMLGSADAPLGSSTQVHAVWTNGAWLLIAYDCDA
jgi:hypothetical protein